MQEHAKLSAEIDALKSEVAESHALLQKSNLGQVMLIYSCENLKTFAEYGQLKHTKNRATFALLQSVIVACRSVS
jgi:hypothetical protein